MRKILIVDDHEVVRKGLVQILKESDPGISMDEAGNAREALNKVLQGNYALVLMDVSMPGRDGLDVLKEIRGLRPRLPVLMLSMHPEEEYAVRALRAGASGYVTKDTAAEELVVAIRKVLGGGVYVSTSLAERLAFEIAGGGAKLPHENLSDREYQVMRMIASGKSVKGIAGELSLSVKTISTYRARILAKMSLRNNAELTRYALENGLAD